MKIGVASEGKEITAKVCPTAGRAPYYLIFEEEKLIKTIKNPFAIGGGGAGNAVIQMLYNEQVNIIISGNFGDNMMGAMKEKKMKYFKINDLTVEKAIKQKK